MKTKQQLINILFEYEPKLQAVDCFTGFTIRLTKLDIAVMIDSLSNNAISYDTLIK